MNRKLRYHSLAERDFVGVAAWSQAQWGAQQTRRYLLVIEAQIQRIAENPMLGKDAELARMGLRKIVAEKHSVFYTANDHEVQIVRIMGQQQDYIGAAGLR